MSLNLLLSKRSWQWWLMGGLFLLPVIFWMVSIFYLGVNVPYQDDIDAIFNWLNHWRTADGWGAHWALLWERHNEHRLVLTRFIVWGYQTVFGSINLVGLMVIGGAALVTVFGTLWQGIKSPNKWRWLWALPFVFFVPHYAEATYWAMTSLQSFFVLLGMVSTLFFLTRSSPSVRYLAYPLAIATTLTGGNGMLIWPVGIFLLSLTKQWRTVIVWGLIGLGFYYFGWTAPTVGGDLSINKFFNLIWYFLTYLGNAFAFGFRSVGLAPIAGMGLLAAFGYLTKIKYYRLNPFLYGVLMFILLTAAVTAVGRVDYGVAQAVSSRYRINSILYITTLFLISVEVGAGWWRKPIWRNFTISIMLTYWLLSTVAGFYALQPWRATLLASQQTINTAYPEWLYPNQARATIIMDQYRSDL